MSDSASQFDPEDLKTWYSGLEMANRNNIFCHCRYCQKEWVDSSLTAVCPDCDSANVEHISCWQFPDD